MEDEQLAVCAACEAVILYFAESEDQGHSEGLVSPAFPQLPLP